MKRSIMIVFPALFFIILGYAAFAYIESEKGLSLGEETHFLETTYDSDGNLLYGTCSRSIYTYIYGASKESLQSVDMSMDIYDKEGNLIDSPVAGKTDFRETDSGDFNRTEYYYLNLPLADEYMAQWKFTLDGEPTDIKEKFSMLPAASLPAAHVGQPGLPQNIRFRG